MKIEIIPVVVRELTTYKYLPFKWCCEEAANSSIVKLTDKDIEGDDAAPKVCISEKRTVDDWGDVFNMEWNHPIRYCPYCGEKIEIWESAPKYVSNDLARLLILRGDLREKIEKLDDPEDIIELSKNIQKVEEKIDDIYEFSEYNSEIYG